MLNRRLSVRGRLLASVMVGFFPATAAMADPTIITNAGTMDGGAGPAISLQNDTNPVIITNSGTIRGGAGVAILTGSGDDVLNLSPGSLIIGTTDLGAGFDTINLNGVGLAQTLSQRLSKTFGGERLNVNSGYWRMVGEVNADVVNIVSGGVLGIDDAGSQAAGGAFITPNGPTLTVINNGALVLNTADTRTDAYADRMYLSGTGAVYLGGGGTMQYGKNVTLTGVTNLNGGTLVVTGDDIASHINVGPTSTLRIGAAYSAPDADGYVTIVPGGGTTGSIASDISNGNLVVFDRANDSTYAGVINGTGRVVKEGGGNLILTGGIGSTGGLTINAGVLTFGNGGTTGGADGDIVTNATLAFDRSDAVTYNRVISGSGGVTQTGAGMLTLTADNTYTGVTTIDAGSTLKLGEGGATGSVAGNILNNGSLIVDRNDPFVTYQGGISGTGTLNKVGSGGLALLGENTYTGLTTVEGGVLQIGGGGNTGSLTSDVSIASGAHLTFLRNDTSTYGGDVSGAGQVTKFGTGTLVLTGNLAQTGITLIDAGTLQVGNGGSTGSVNGHIINSGSLAFNRSDDITFTGSVTGAGAITKLGANTLTVTGSVSSVGGPGITIAAGTLRIGNGGTTGSLTGNVLNNGVLVIDRSTSYAQLQTISGSGSLIKAGSGQLFLNGVQTYTGGTTVAAGSLFVRGSMVGPTTLAAGTVLEVATRGSMRGINGNGATIINSGTIETPGLNTGMFATIALGDAGSTVSNAGVIRSYNGNAVRFGAGVDTLILATGSVIAGRVDMGGGIDTVNAAGTATTKTATQSFGNIFGSELLNINSGYWTLNGEVEAKTVSVASGATFEVDDAGSADGAFISSGADPLSIVNNGAVVINTADTRTDIYADNLHLGGTGALELTGGGTIQYGQNVTMTGRTTITNGQIVVTGDNIATPFTVGAQGRLRIGAAYSAPDADGYVTIVQGGGLTGSVTGDIDLVAGGRVLFDRADDLTYSGNITGVGSTGKMGAGTLTLTGSVDRLNMVEGGLVVAGSVGTLTGIGGNVDIASTGTVGWLTGNGLSYTNAGTINLVRPADPIDITAAVSLTSPIASVFTNSGQIRSTTGQAMRFGSTNDTLNLMTGSDIQGRVDMGLGTDTINLAGTSATRTTSQVVGNIFGSEILNVNSGYWTLNREVEADNVSIAGGATLDIDSIGAAPGEGGFLSSHGDVLTIVNNGAAIVSTDDARLDIYADDLHLSGSGTLELRGGGSIQLGQNFTQTGGTTVTDGLVVVTGDNIASPITVASAGTLRVGAAYSAPDADGYVHIVPGGGTTGSLTGDVANNGAVIFDRANDSIYAGSISGTGAVAKRGGGTLTLTGANSNTGLTTVEAGILQVGNGGTTGSITGDVAIQGGGQLIFDRADDSTYAGAISGGYRVTKRGGGVLTLAGSTVAPVYVEQGGLVVSGTLSPLGISVISDGGALTITSTGASGRLGGNGATITNAGTIDFIHSGGFGGATIELGRASTVNNSGLIRASNGFAIHFRDEADTLNLATGSSIVGRVEMGAGADVINLAGTTATKTGAQTFGDIFGSETLNVNSGYWTLDDEVEADFVNIASGATLEMDSVGAAPGQGGFISGNAAFKTVVDNGAIIQNTSDARLDDGADTLHLSGSGTVELKGGGALQYGANVSLTGATTVTNGTLVVTGDNIASALNVGSQGVVRIGAAFSAPDADGFVTLASGGGTTGSVAGNIANNGAVIFDRADASTYAGAMSGTGVVTKSGAGVLTLSGANTYTGATTVTGGGLVVSGPFASSGVSLVSGAGLTFTGPNALTYAGVVSGAGGLAKTGTGVATLSGANTYTGATTVGSGGLTVTGSIASQAVSVTSGATFTFGSSSDQTYGGVISGAGSLGKSGAGSLTLTGANTYTGGTTVSGGSLILPTTLVSDVTVAQGGTLQIGTGGTTGSLTGDLVANGTVIFNRSDDYLFAGDFSGNGALIKRGAGLLTLDGLYTFSGTTSIEAGTIKITQLDADGSLVVGDGASVDLSGSNQTVGGLTGGSGSTVNIENATLTINQPQSNTPTVFNGSLSGDGALVVTGDGVFDLAGTNTYTGPTTVDGGTLKINGSITSTVTVNDGGTLGGSGTIGGAVTVGSGGAISPGNSPGVTTIAGPLTLASGSSMIVEVDPTATVQNDRIDVTAGAATIAAGAKLDVRPLGAIANYDRVSDYTILTATGGVNGTFGANVTSTMALLTPSVSYSTNAVKLRLIRNDISFASLADTANQAAVADAAEATGPSGAAYGALIGQDEAGARAGYDALSGELYGTAGSLMIDEGRHQRAVLLRQAASGDRGAWASLYNGEVKADAGAGFAASRDKSFGLTGGGQTSAGAWNLGFALGFSESDIEVVARSSVNSVETLRAGVYGGRDFYDDRALDRVTWRVRFGADLAKHGFEAKRGIAFPTVTESVAADYDGASQQVFGEVAYNFGVGPGNLEPFVEIAAVRSKTDAFTETGGTLGLSVSEQERNVTFATVGARYEASFDTGGGAVVRPRLSLAWRRAGGDIEGTSTAAFGTSAFTVVGAGVAKDTALIDAGAGFDITSSVTGSLSYSGALSSDAKDHAIRAGLFVRF